MSRKFPRHEYKDRYILPHRQSSNEYRSSINKKLYMIQLRRRRRTDSIFSFYDNNITDENELVTSKWTIVRQRLPDILALSPTYKPKSVRAQLILLIALMNKQTNPLQNLSNHDYDLDTLCIPTNVIVEIGGRSRLIALKRIPPEQMIHVDIDGLAFSIPTRQFIIAISRGNAHETAANYCPPAIGDMLINLSKRKVVHDGRRYRRKLFKLRLGKIFFFTLFIFISGMVLVLITSATNAFIQVNSFNYTDPAISIERLSSTVETDDFWMWR